MKNYIAEAFTALKMVEETPIKKPSLLKEEKFDLNDEDDIIAAKEMIDSEDEELPVEQIIDVDAEDESDLKDTYVGSFILKCPVCNTLMYKDESEIVRTDDEELVNFEDICPHCKSQDGFEIIGKVAPIEVPEEEPIVDEEPVEEEPLVDVEDEEPVVDDEKEVVEESLNENNLKEEYFYNDEDENSLQVLASEIWSKYSDISRELICRLICNIKADFKLSWEGNELYDKVDEAIASGKYEDYLDLGDSSLLESLNEMLEPLSTFKTFEYANKTNQGHEIVKAFKEKIRTDEGEDYRIHVIAKNPHRNSRAYAVGIGYSLDNGYWNQGRYDFETAEEAEESLKQDYSVEPYEIPVVISEVKEPEFKESLTEAKIYGIDWYYRDEYVEDKVNQVFEACPNVNRSEWESEIEELINDIVGDMGYSGGSNFWLKELFDPKLYNGEDNPLYVAPEELKKALTATIKSIFRKPKNSKPPVYHVDISGGEEECPYLVGWVESENPLSISNRYDLTEEELWQTGWIASLQNEEKGPFKSFKDMDLYCYDEEKGNEYPLPAIDTNIKDQYLKAVNEWIKAEGSYKEEAEDFEFESFNEKSFDTLVNEYLNKTYKNTDKYVTENISLDEDKLVVEGKLTFKSGKESNINFVFETKNTMLKNKFGLRCVNESFNTSFNFSGELKEGELVFTGLKCKNNSLTEAVDLMEKPGTIAYVFSKKMSELVKDFPNVTKMKAAAFELLDSDEIKVSDKEKQKAKIKLEKPIKPSHFLSVLSSFCTGIRVSDDKDYK